MKIRFAALALAVVASAAAPAQDYPARPVRLVVPYAAGGNADIFGRTLAQKLGGELKQPFVVENRAGANGGIELAADFHVVFPAGYAAHQIRLEGGDCSTDSFCYPSA